MYNVNNVSNSNMLNILNDSEYRKYKGRIDYEL